MRRIIVLCASMALAIIFPSLHVNAGLKTVEITAGVYGCKDEATSVVWRPTKSDGITPYTRKTDVSRSCNDGNSLIAFLGTAEATPISKALGANPDGTYDTGNPCIDGSTSCKGPTAASIAWTQSCLNTALAPQNSVIVGVAVDASVEACASGTNLAAATMSVVLASDGATNCNATNLSITGSQPNRKLHNSATGAGTGSCKLKLTYMGASVLSASFPWTNSSSVGGDGTPPTSVTGVTCTGGTLSATCTFDAQMDPDDAVPRSGVSEYRIYSDLTAIDTLAAASPGLTCDFTPQTIGAAVSGSPSATQGTGFSGAQWSLNSRGYGLELTDSYYGTSCPVSGSSVYVIARVDSVAAGLTYNKAIIDIRNGTSTTAAHYACTIMRQVIGGATTYYAQRTYRAIDGGNNSSTISVQLAGAPPYYLRASDVSNQGGCDYSTDGGAWTTIVSGDPITLNDAKIAVAGGSATSSGSDDAAEAVVFGSVAVQTAGRLSKTVTLAAGTHSLNVSSKDVTGNESGQNASASVTVASGGAGTHKFFPGNYVVNHQAHGIFCGTGCDTQRRGNDSLFLTDSNVKGVEVYIDWKYLESDAGNDFTAGIAWLTAEIAYINTSYPGKKVGVLLNISPYGYTGLTNANQTFPQYFVNAGCVYNEDTAISGGGTSSLNWFKNNPTCLGYFTRLMNAYGAAFDTNTTLAFIRIQQETDDNPSCCGITGTAEDTAWKNIAQAAATAFPTTPIWIPINWVGVETAANKEALLLYYKSIQVGMGNGDTQPKDLAYSCASTAWVCVVLGLNSSIGGTSHSNCGEFVSFGAVELSEMGYNSVTDPVGGLTSSQVVNSWNSDSCQQFGVWDINNNETGTPATMYWNGAQGQKWAIDNIPLVYTSKPSGFQ